MKQFTDDIIAYLKERLNADTDIPKEVKVDYANNQSIKITPPHIFIQPMQDTDAEQYDTFYEGEVISYCPVQITPYCQQMRVGGDGKPMVSAQEVSMIMADKISRLFDKRVALAWNKNIVRLRRVGDSFGMPTEDGSTTYASPIRYEFYVSRDYKKIN